MATSATSGRFAPTSEKKGKRITAVAAGGAREEMYVCILRRTHVSNNDETSTAVLGVERLTRFF